LRPVISDTRVGEHTEHEYACVNRTTPSARRYMFGVRYRSLNGVRDVWKGTEVSCQPMSSTRNSTRFGGIGSS